MSRPRSQFRRPDLLYRQLIRDEQDSPNDQLFDALTKKVVQHLHDKAIPDWDKDEWGTYRAMLAQHQKQPLMQASATEEMELMSEEELTATTRGDDPLSY